MCNYSILLLTVQRAKRVFRYQQVDSAQQVGVSLRERQTNERPQQCSEHFAPNHGRAFTEPFCIERVRSPGSNPKQHLRVPFESKSP